MDISENVSVAHYGKFDGASNCAVIAGIGFYTKTDLGIVKYHFEQAAGVGREIWVEA